MSGSDRAYITVAAATSTAGSRMIHLRCQAILRKSSGPYFLPGNTATPQLRDNGCQNVRKTRAPTCEASLGTPTSIDATCGPYRRRP